MSDIAWNSVGTVLIMYLMTFPSLLFLASNALTHRVIATRASPEIIRRFLEALPMPVRSFFAGLSQHHLESATQNYANMEST
jgi:hypothetical protein